MWEINRKDLGDTVCLLADHGVAADVSPGGESISLGRVAAVLGADWGFCHTVGRNLGKIADLWAEEPLPGGTRDVAAEVRAIQAAIAAAPKTRSWRLRARIGERVRWYETPEEVRH